ncbi:hypothetical protein JKP88DRAFT_245822 [Tribonema minus]|uniref:Uncharacterized protein n=1 Tax=Tribonema minus TaxID=303371 RepID=A0A836CDW3_9STRA|nr:hypothetical protein JKP88DRAFT_245822 [Tribonema minus]
MAKGLYVCNIVRQEVAADVSPTTAHCSDMFTNVGIRGNENTTAGFNINLASVFGALKRSGAERYMPDVMDIAATHAYMRSADQGCNSHHRRRLRADVAVSRALDSGGLKSMKAAGRLCDIEDDGLRDMMQALLQQIWSRE